MRTFFSFALILTSVSSATAIDIAEKNRIPNDTKIGVCWWACADTVAHHLNIPELKGIKQKVLLDGTGRDSGATRESVEYWNKKLDLNVATFWESDKPNFEIVRQYLDKGLPVIISVHSWPTTADGTHAIIVTNVSKEKEKFDHAGTSHFDYIVNFIDPNRVQFDSQHTQAWLEKRWHGRAVVYAPRAVTTDLERSKRLYVGEIKKDPSGIPIKGTQQLLLPLIDVHQYSGHRTLKSNQDIKDGVNRPDDLLRVPLRSSGSIDYSLPPK